MRLLIGLGSLIALGCGANPGMVRVEGTISYRGQPLKEGYVNFEPLDPAKGDDAASGRIGPDGRYELRTRKPGDGIAPGKYRIAVRSENPQVPFEYESADRSPLTAEVLPEPELQILDFDLKDAAKPIPRPPQ